MGLGSEPKILVGSAAVENKGKFLVLEIKAQCALLVDALRNTFDLILTEGIGSGFSKVGEVMGK